MPGMSRIVAVQMSDNRQLTELPKLATKSIPSVNLANINIMERPLLSCSRNINW